MFAIEVENGSFAIKTALDSILIYGLIVKTPLGWKVMNRTSARRNSRTESATPEQAARKYFSKKVTFVRIPKPKDPRNQPCGIHGVLGCWRCIEGEKA